MDTDSKSPGKADPPACTTCLRGTARRQLFFGEDLPGRWRATSGIAPPIPSHWVSG